jgi:hypothetical protein
MFETLYRYSRVLVRHLDGPAAEERDRFVTHVAAAGAARESLLHLASELLLVAQRLDVSGTRTITPEEIASAADRWVRHQRRHGRISAARYSHQRFVQVATDWLRFLGRLESPPVMRGTGADLVDEFAAGMRLERGLSPNTVYKRCWHVQAFLTWLDEQHGCAGAATLEDVDGFLAMRGAQGWCRVSIATAATALRSFFKHMAATGPSSLHHLVASRMRSLDICCPRQGPHALRHACATHLVAEGLSLKQIGDHLGHRSPQGRGSTSRGRCVVQAGAGVPR